MKSVLRLAGLALVLLVLAVVVWLWFPRPVTLEIKGTKGLRFAGFCEIDGATQSVAGTIPTNVTFRVSRSIFFELRKERSSLRADAPALMSINLSVHDVLGTEAHRITSSDTYLPTGIRGSWQRSLRPVMWIGAY